MTAIADEDGCIRRVLVMMMMSDGDLDPDELSTAQRVYADVTGRQVTEEELRAQARLVAEEGWVPGQCAGLGEGLDEAAKVRVLGAAFAVAAADGFVVDEEDRLLWRLASDMNLSPETYQAAIERFLTVGTQ